MDNNKDSGKTVARPRGRPATRSSKKVTADLAPRPTLKRKRRRTEDQIPAMDVNGSKDADSESESEDGESPNKKSKVETEGAMHDGDDEDEMEVQEKDDHSENAEDQEMTQTEDYRVTTLQSSHDSAPLLESIPAGHMNPRVMLQRRPPIRTEDPATVPTRTNRAPLCSDETDRAVPARMQPTRLVPQRRPAENMSKVPSSMSSMAQYREKMEAKAKSNDIPRIYPDIKRPPPPTSTRQCVNNIPAKRKPEKSLHKSQGVKKSAVKGSAESPSRGCIWWLVPLLLLLCSAALLAYNKDLVLEDGREHIARSVVLDGFAAHMSALEAQFPSQRAELWKRSRIHLGKHLEMEQPTEPVSLMLTAGRKAERTLHCLARGLASAFSSALNASVLHIDGAGKAHMDSDQVKLDIDNQLRGAFEGDKPAAVIHRFEELPPGSTLIFYRYCDHENSAYKQVFLAFTVLLPQEEVQEHTSMKDAEELVHDYINKRFVDPDQQTQSDFNTMDVNKLSGLWSRISHLILPVAAEDEVEQKGCQ